MMRKEEREQLLCCRLCPHECGCNRLDGERGVCGAVGETVRVARIGPHLWEEPCISGEHGSGTVFFGGCNLGCIYCQNRAISRDCVGREYTIPALADAFLTLQKSGVENLNLVTPTHYSMHIRAALRMAKEQGFFLPVVYKTGGYERVEVLRMLEGYVDVYLPDFKYGRKETAAYASGVSDYPEVARAAICEMVRQTGAVQFDDAGRMTRGTLVRHLLLPGEGEAARGILADLFETYGDQIYLSIMNQYTPPPELHDAKFSQTISEAEYEALLDYAVELGITQAFVQEGGTVSESFIPTWELS